MIRARCALLAMFHTRCALFGLLAGCAQAPSQPPSRSTPTPPDPSEPPPRATTVHTTDGPPPSILADTFRLLANDAQVTACALQGGVPDTALPPGRTHVLDRPRTVPILDEDVVQVRGTVVDGFAWFIAEAPSGEADLLVDGYAPTPIHWVDAHTGQVGHCTLGPVALIPGETRIRGRVRNATVQGSLGAQVEGCGATEPVRSDGSFEIVAHPLPCTLRAMRADGRVVVRGDPISLHPRRGQVLDIELALPQWRGGGLGMGFDLIPGAVEIRDLLPSGPAQREGLRVGDKLLEVGGIGTSMLDPITLRALMTGREGTKLTLVVDSGDGPRAISMRREWLPPDDDPLPPRPQDVAPLSGDASSR